MPDIPPENRENRGFLRKTSVIAKRAHPSSGVNRQDRFRAGGDSSFDAAFLFPG